MKFEQLAKGNIGENRNLVVSEREDGKISIAQQIETQAGEQQIDFFVKNAIPLNDVDGLKTVRDIINDAIEELS